MRTAALVLVVSTVLAACSKTGIGRVHIDARPTNAYPATWEAEADAGTDALSREWPPLER